MLTALVPTPINDLVNRQEPEKDYKKMYEDACLDVEKMYQMYHEQKLAHVELREKYKELEEEHCELLGREDELERQLAKLTAKYMSVKYELEAAQKCIVNMALKLHGGDNDA